MNKTISNRNRERQKITISLTRGQAQSIQANGRDLFGGCGYGRRRGDMNVGEQLAKQIVKKAGKLFPEIAEEDRQSQLAWKIKEELRYTLRDVRSKHEDEIHEAHEVFEQAHKAMMAIENLMEKEADAIIDVKFDEAGITMFRSHGGGLTMPDISKPEPGLQSG